VDTQERSPQEYTGEPLDEAEALHSAAHRITPLVEALLFVASEPIDTKRIAKLTGEDEKAVAIAIASLQETYADRGISVREVAGGYRFATSTLARDVVEAYLLPPKTSLSTPALEALAIVAHMSPVTKSEIEAIRGVNSDSVVNTLLERGLIAEAGRKDVVGRPMQYETTSLFLESFGLNSLKDLPPFELEPGQPLELELLPAATSVEEGEPARAQTVAQKADDDMQRLEAAVDEGE